MPYSGFHQLNGTHGWMRGKHLLLTGASSGIGRELAVQSMGVCDRLTLVSRNRDGRLCDLVTELEDIGKSGADFNGHANTRVQARAFDIRDRQALALLLDQIYRDEKDQ